MGELGQDQPVLRSALHPGADVRHDRAQRPGSKIGTAQGAESSEGCHIPVHQLWCTGALFVKVPAESVARRPGIGYSSVVARRDPQQFYEGFIAVFRRVRAVAEQGYAPLEIGTAQAKLLRHIGQDSRISQADLARATGTAPTLTGRALEPLIERGWVRRKRS